jgi:protein-S-isoprenylcysteine O-methyltransferase Ste14
VPTLGPRGEGWVLLQSLVFGAIVACGVFGPDWPHRARSPLQAVGAALEVCGLALGALGVRALGSSFTPFPCPRETGGLRRDGIYRKVRHPIYGAVLVFAAGWSLQRSPIALVPTALLAAVFELKSQREELWLTERYPEYADYRAATRHRFIPWLI